MLLEHRNEVFIVGQGTVDQNTVFQMQRGDPSRKPN